MRTINGINGASRAHSLSFRSLGYIGVAIHEMPSEICCTHMPGWVSPDAF